MCWGLTSQSTIFQSCRDGAIASWVINQYFRGVKCLAQGHNTAAVGLEPRTSRSGVRHSTTEPPRSPNICCGCSPRRGDSNEYPQHTFLWRSKQKHPSIITKYPPYLFHWVHNWLQSAVFHLRPSALWFLSTENGVLLQRIFPRVCWKIKLNFVIPASVAPVVECPLRGTGGHGFHPGPRHTKVVKMVLVAPVATRHLRVAERLALPTSDHGVAGSNPAGGEILPEPKRRFIAQNLSCSPFHRLEMTEILLKGRKTLNSSIHPSWYDLKLLKATLNPNKEQLLCYWTVCIWAASWQNQQNDCAPSEDSDQPGHLSFFPFFLYVLTSVEDIRRGSVHKCKGGGGLVE